MAYKAGRCLLRVRLREAGLKAADVAERLGMKESQISDYANNRKRMSLETAKNIAVIVGCHIDDLYDWIDIKPSQRKRIRRQGEQE